LHSGPWPLLEIEIKCNKRKPLLAPYGVTRDVAWKSPEKLEIKKEIDYMKTRISESRFKIPRHALARFVPMGLVAIGLLTLSTEKTAAQARDSSPQVIPPNAHYDGLSYAEWLTKLWQWTLAIPSPQNPALPGNEANIGLGQPDHVWFVPLHFGFEPSDRTFTVPAGKALFVPIYTGYWDNSPCVGEPTSSTEEELRARLLPPLDTAVIEVEVDGVAVKDVAQYRFPSPVFSMTYPPHNLAFDAGCTDSLGTWTPAVADGYALMLTPFSVGKHTIHEHIVIPYYNAVMNNTIHINVVPHGGGKTR
jgi:hypothetical protein